VHLALERAPAHVELAEARRVAHERLAGAIDERGDFAAAAGEVRALMFIERFAADVDDRLVALEG
jgi:molecular chaperone HscB